MCEASLDEISYPASAGSPGYRVHALSGVKLVNHDTYIYEIEQVISCRNVRLIFFVPSSLINFNMHLPSPSRPSPEMQSILRRGYNKLG